jgi:hypothetical protein
MNQCRKLIWGSCPVPCRQANQLSTHLQAALAPTGLKLAPLPVPKLPSAGLSAQAPSALPGMAVAGMPSATMPMQDETAAARPYYAAVRN